MATQYSMRGLILGTCITHPIQVLFLTSTLVCTLPQGATAIRNWDIDDGLMVLDPDWEVYASGQSNFILFDLSTQRADVIDLDFVFNDVEIIRLGE